MFRYTMIEVSGDVPIANERHSIVLARRAYHTFYCNKLVRGVILDMLAFREV